MSPRHSRELSAAAAGAAADSRLSALTRTTTRLVTDKPSSVTAYKESWKEWKGERWGGGGGGENMQNRCEKNIRNFSTAYEAGEANVRDVV